MEFKSLYLQTSTEEDAYWKIWQAEQEHMKIRWNNATFFMSISFAILGFSFQNHLTTSAALAIRVSGLIIYWFAYILFLLFHRYTRVLRDYMRDMEISGYVSFNFQTRTDEKMRPNRSKKLIESTWLLLYFGLLYTAGIILLSFLRL